MSGIVLTWEQLSKSMEEYANSLSGEDEYLPGYEPEEGEDKAKKKKPKYTSKEGPFCGKAGGMKDPKSFPVGSKKRAIAALAYARHAPKPGGIKKCVCRHWPSLPACKKKKKGGDLLTDMWDNI